MAFWLIIVLVCRHKTQTTKTPVSRREQTVPMQAPHVFIDGPNVAWTKGDAPRSQYIVSAMHYFRALGAVTTIVLPRSMVACEQKRRLCDAHAHARHRTAQLQQRDSEATENDARGEPVFSLHGTTWQHNALWREHELGHIVLVDRVRACDDDLATISLARSRVPCAWLCSNDKYRDHTRQRPNKPRSELSSWLKQRRIEYSFGGIHGEEFRANFATPAQRRLFLSSCCCDCNAQAETKGKVQ